MVTIERIGSDSKSISIARKNCVSFIAVLLRGLFRLKPAGLIIRILDEYMTKHPLRRKNIDRVVSDVRKPRLPRLYKDDWQPQSSLEIKRPQRRWHKIVAAVAAVVGIVIVVYAGYLLVVRNKMGASTNVLFGNLQYLIFGPTDRLSGGRGEIQAAANDINSSVIGASPLKLLPFLREIPSGLSQIRQLASALIDVSNSFTALRIEGFNFFFSGRGGDILALLKNTDAGFKKVSALSDSIRDIANKFDIMPTNTGGDYLALETEIRRQTATLDALITLLERPESHILLLLEDASTMRPGGGRIAAYADIGIAGGSFKDIKVKSISMAEKYLDADIIPPVPLQAQETAWKIRDANWFFNFPSAAAKVKSLIEAAESGEGNAVQYTGVIAVTSDVIADLVDALQPIQVDSLKKSITASNLDSEIRRLGYERFMDIFLPAVAVRAREITGDEQHHLAGLAESWLTERKVRLYFQDAVLQDYVLNSDWGGGVWPLPDDFSGDYLGFARADIGTKTSVQETISLRSTIDADGRIHNNLTIIQNNGSGTVSQDFMQVFVPNGSHLTQIAGNTYKKVSPPANYNRLGYTADADVAAIESTRTVDALDYAETFDAFGRNAFGFWLSLQPHTTRTVSLTYDSTYVKIFDGARYQFITERQPGENIALNYGIEAPQGWRWRESGRSAFYYNADHIPGRTVINLTLEKDTQK
jgi:hypothetical protein